ncbi:MAG TPA: DUF6600 domain-containing protein, partial [Verrucomicrobiae bacterium]|nr:DUF6600 domain-containing protein [Verrucomicrobiae bacterium]
MKTGLLRSWKLVIIAVGLPLAGGSLSGPGFIATAEETIPADASSAVLASQPEPQPAVPTPPDVKLSPGAAEVAKLAQAGLSEDVMLAYISNANSSFMLGSDQIVYLNDLGVSGTVVKAMIQRETQLTSAAQDWAAANQPSVTPAPYPPQPSDDGIGSYSYPSAPMDNPDAANPGDVADYAAPVDYSTTDDTDYFYNSLAPYGSWIYIAGAGRCWQPTVCVGNHGWQPYFDRGRWIYTDCGWYWRSDYSWGWAAFHYGRWFNDEHRGWCWRPDHVWGPAWVSWRHSADYCGWAPLPPSAHFVPGVGFQHRGHSVAANFDFGLRASQYTFIPVGRMTDYSPYRYAASSSRAAELFHQTTVNNQVTFEHNHVVSHSIDPKQVAMASGIEVRPAQIHETPTRPNTSVVSDHLAKQGDSLMIFRPRLSPAGSSARPRQFFAPPARTSGAPKTSLNNSTSAATGSQAVLGGSPAQRPASTLPGMNFASTASASQRARTEFYPSSSLVVVGEKSGNTPQPSST